MIPLHEVAAAIMGISAWVSLLVATLCGVCAFLRVTGFRRRVFVAATVAWASLSSRTVLLAITTYSHLSLDHSLLNIYLLALQTMVFVGSSGLLAIWMLLDIRRLRDAEDRWGEEIRRAAS